MHASLKFSVFIAGRAPETGPSHCAFYLHDVTELSDPERRFQLAAADFQRIIPTAGPRPFFGRAGTLI